MTDLLTATPTAAATPVVEHRTTGQLLAAYDARQRAVAASAGHPTDRTYVAGMSLAGGLGRVIYTGSDSRLYVLDLRDGTEPVRLTYAMLRTALADAYDLADPAVKIHTATVIADRESLHRMVQMAERHSTGPEATPETRRLTRLLGYRAGLPTSVYTPILTESLAMRYWLPTGLDAKHLDGWAGAFTLTGEPTGRSALTRLITLAMDGETDPDFHKTLKQAELWGARAARYASTSSACSAFTKATSIQEAFSSLTNLDPLLRGRNAIDGSVAQIRILQIDSRAITATVSDPFRLRERSKVLLFDGHETLDRVEVTLRSVDFKDGQLIAEFSLPPNNKGKSHIVHEAKQNYRSLFAAAAPFLMVKSSPKNARWVPVTEGEGEDRTLPVDIPVDIALAGAPVAPAAAA